MMYAYLEFLWHTARVYCNFFSGIETFVTRFSPRCILPHIHNPVWCGKGEHQYAHDVVTRKQILLGILLAFPPSPTMANVATPSSTFTEDKDLDLAFPTEYIPAEVRAALSEDLHVRRSRRPLPSDWWSNRLFLIP